MRVELMIHNANQIALFFASFPKEEAVEGVLEHIRKFWERRMKEQLLTYARDEGGTGLHELVIEASKRLA